MYGIYANIGGILMVNVTIYSIHGSYSMGYKSAINPVQSTSVKHVGEIRTYQNCPMVFLWGTEASLRGSSTSSSDPSFGQV